MFDLVDACIEHLGVLPSQIDLTNAQVSELLAYHNIKRKSQNICGDCYDKDRKRVRTCFICNKQYTEENNRTGSSSADEVRDFVRGNSGAVYQHDEESKKHFLDKAQADLRKSGKIVDKIELPEHMK